MFSLSCRVSQTSSQSRWLVRLSLFVGICLGGIGLIYLLTLSDIRIGDAFHAYYVAAQTANDGRLFYDVSYVSGGGTYLYPPATVLVFFPFLLVGGWFNGYLIMIFINILAAGLLGYILVRFIEDRTGLLPLLDRILVFGYTVLSLVTAMVYLQGQINLLLGLLITYGFLATLSDNHEWSGFLFAIAASFKIFPALLGTYLLRKRAFKALLIAVATGGLSLLVGLGIFGVDTTKYYFQQVLFGGDILTLPIRPEVQRVTLWRPLSQLLPNLDVALYFILSVLLVSPLIYITYRDITTENDALVAILATILVTIIVVPSRQPYLVVTHFPLVALLFLLKSLHVRAFLSIGTILLNLSFTLSNVRAVAKVGLSPSLSESVIAVVTPILTFTSPPLVGILLISLGLIFQTRS